MFPHRFHFSPGFLPDCCLHHCLPPSLHLLVVGTEPASPPSPLFFFSPTTFQSPSLTAGPAHSAWHRWVNPADVLSGHFYLPPSFPPFCAGSFLVSPAAEWIQVGLS